MMSKNRPLAALKNRPLAGPLAALGGKLLLIWLLSFLLLFFESCVIGSNDNHIPILQYEIIDIFPHDLPRDWYGKMAFYTRVPAFTGNRPCVK